MPAIKRMPVKGYKGVHFIQGTQVGTGKPEKVFYIRYRRAGKLIEEKAGRQYQDDMTAARASALRAKRIEGDSPSNEERREAIRASKEAEEGRWTFDRLWAEWMIHNAHKKGRVNDDNRYRTHLQPLFGDKEPSEVAPFDVDRLRNALLKGKAHAPGRKFDPDARRRADYSKEKIRQLAEQARKRGQPRPYAVATVVSVLSLLRRIAMYGEKKGLCEGLRFKVEVPKGAKLKTEDMSEEQMGRYIRVCREWPDIQAGNFQLIALCTGMRRGELRNLQWADVDMERGFLHIRDPKGGEDQIIPMNDSAATVLKSHPRVSRNPFVFAGAEGGARGLRQISESARAIKKAAGLPEDFRPLHGLRHTFASHLASSGVVDLFTLSKLLTHKTPTVTTRYAHLRDDALRRASNVMGGIVAAAGEKTGEGR